MLCTKAKPFSPRRFRMQRAKWSEFATVVNAGGQTDPWAQCGMQSARRREGDGQLLQQRSRMVRECGSVVCLHIPSAMGAGLRFMLRLSTFSSIGEKSNSRVSGE